MKTYRNTEDKTPRPLLKPIGVVYRFTDETNQAAREIPVGTVAERDHQRGLSHLEPLIVMMDCLLRYAKAYRKQYDSTLQADSVLGPEWLAAAKGVRGLLNGDGAVAMENNYGTDSKDNGAVETVFWKAIEAAGFTEADL